MVSEICEKVRRILQCLRRYHASVFFQLLDETNLISAIQMKRKKNRLKPSTSLFYSLSLFPLFPPNLLSSPLILHSRSCSCSPSYSLTHFPFFPRLICYLLHSSSIAELGSCSPFYSLSLFPFISPNLLSSPLILHSRVE